MRFVKSDAGRDNFLERWPEPVGDCAVVAFTHVLSPFKDYAQVRVELEELQGEPYSAKKQGTGSGIIEQYANQHGFNRIELEASVPETRLNPKAYAAYLFASAGHIWAVINRVAYDSFDHYKFQVSEIYYPSTDEPPKISPRRFPDLLDHPIQISIDHSTNIIRMDGKKIGELPRGYRNGWYKVRNSIKKWPIHHSVQSDDDIRIMIFATWNRDRS